MLRITMPDNNSNKELWLELEVCYAYLELIKQRYRQRPQIFDEFVKIMKDYLAKTIDVPGVVHRVVNLFEGDPELIMGFNLFLPREWECRFEVEVYYDQAQATLPTLTPISSTPNVSGCGGTGNGSSNYACNLAPGSSINSVENQLKTSN